MPAAKPVACLFACLTVSLFAQPAPTVLAFEVSTVDDHRLKGRWNQLRLKAA